MTEFVLRISMDNEAFTSDDGMTELSRCLADVLTKVGEGWDHASVLDANGNTVGTWGIVDSEVTR